MDMKRFFLYAIVIAALALAGCGGGGNGTTPVDPGPVDPPPPMSYDVTVPADVMLSAADMMPFTGTMTVGDVTFTCPSGSTCTLTQADDGTISSTGGQVTAAFSQDYNDRMDAAALAKGMGIATALATPNGPVPAGSTDAAAAGGPTGVKVERATTGTPKITLTLADGDDADSLPDLFAAADDITRSMPPALTGWMGQTQSRTVAGTTDMVTVYTDIKNATPQKLKYSDATGATVIPDPATTGNLIVLEDQEGDYSNDDGTEIKGTVNGIAGTFTCAGDSCTAVATLGTGATPGQDANTVTTALAVGWSFESDENIESQATQDPDYLYFGYWLQDEGDNDFAFNTFFGGAAQFTPPNALLTNTDAAFTAVESKAVYNGGAAGKYVEKTLAIQGGTAEPVAIAGDYFTADAQLTAYFGTSTDVPSNMHNTIRGTISDFKNSSGDDVNFRINLESIDFSTTTDGSFTGGEVAGIHGSGSDITQTLEGTAGGGWKGQFFGPAAETGAEATTRPTGVAGDFQAHFNDAHVVGAFGATR